MTMKVLSLLSFTLLSLLFPFVVTASTNPTGECLPVNDNEFNCFPIDGIVECENDHPNCDEWAKRNECKNNAQYMIYNCRKSCETCVSIHHGETQKCTKPEQLDDIVKLLVETQQYIYDKTSVRASMFGSCVNKDPLCAEFALRGECKENPNYMTQHCAAVCKACR